MKSPKSWDGHVAREPILDPPLSFEQRVVLALFFVALAAVCGVGLVLSVLGAMK